MTAKTTPPVGTDDRLTVWRAHDGAWRWRRSAAGNFAEICTSMPYPTRHNAVRAARRANPDLPHDRLVDCDAQ